MLAIVAGRRRHRADAVAVELDELLDHAVAAEDLRDRQHEVGGGRALGELAVELKPDDLRGDDVDRLAEHARLGLDAADAPPDDAQPVDHRRVAVGADERVGERDAVADLHDLGEVLEVDLVDDAGARRDDLEVVERLLAPLEELVALLVALELHLRVVHQRELRAELVDLHGVVDHEVDRHERVDLLRVAARAPHGGAHGGEVDDGRHAGEVLEHDARDLERHLDGVGLLGVPLGQPADVVLGHLEVVRVAQAALEQHLDRERELVHVPDAHLGEAVEPEVPEVAALG
jgi:hypothetical protein